MRTDIRMQMEKQQRGYSLLRRSETLSYRSVIVFCAVILSCQASPLNRIGLQPEQINFVYDGPRNSISSSGGAQVKRVVEGENAVLECEAWSRSVPTIHWLHRGKLVAQAGVKPADDLVFDIVETNSNPTSFTRSRLFLDCVSPRMAGEYICVADTPTSRNISVWNLDLDELPHGHKENRLISHRNNRRPSKGLILKRSSKCERNQIENAGYARIYQWTTGKIAEMGGDVRLLCRATGFPQLKISWFGPHNDPAERKPIRSDDIQYQILENGDLVIKKTTFEDMGSYRCEADNGHGVVDKKEMFFYPALKPKIP